MNLPAALFPWPWQLFALLVALICGVWIVRRAPWKRLGATTQFNLLAGTSVGMMLLWSMKAGVYPGLELHMLGAMLATLTLGPQLAMLAMGVALGGTVINGDIGLVDWPINFAFMVVVPVLIADRLRWLVVHRLPANFFVFVFVGGFFGAALTLLAQGAVVSSALVLAGAYPASLITDEYLPYFLLLGFSEGWINGGIVTLMVIYRPEWVMAFDDRRYLWRR